MTTTSTLAAIYECADCGERSTDRRCPDCNLFTRRLGTGGNCPNCDEPVLIEELLNPTHQAPPHTENLTGPLHRRLRTALLPVCQAFVRHLQ